MTSTTKKLKKFEQRVQQEVKKLQRTVYAKRLEHTRLRDAAMLVFGSNRTIPF